jgi:hypothetical protein
MFSFASLLGLGGFSWPVELFFRLGSSTASDYSWGGSMSDIPIEVWMGALVLALISFGLQCWQSWELRQELKDMEASRNRYYDLWRGAVEELELDLNAETFRQVWIWAHRDGNFIEWHEELEDWWNGDPSAMERFEEWKESE